MATLCLDDPASLLNFENCVEDLSKDLEGNLELDNSKVHVCPSTGCETLKTVHRLKVEAKGHNCDSALGQLLDGTIVVEKLISNFRQDGHGRAVHSGDFTWFANGVQVEGRVSGVTNVGTHREPVFGPCQKCDDLGVMEGRLCGQVTQTQFPELKDCYVQAAYRIRFDPDQGGGSGTVFGTLEGVILCPCS